MHTNDLLHCDRSYEPYKGGVHLVAGAVHTVCGAYTLGAVFVRPCVRLVVQTVFHFGVAGWEFRQTYRHWAGR